MIPRVERWTRGLANLLMLAAIAGILSGCSEASKPIVRIQLPANPVQINDGDDLVVRASAADPKGIARVELAVDNVVARVDQIAVPQKLIDVDQSWKATNGPHTLSVRAFNTDNVASEPAMLAVTVYMAVTRVPTQPAPTAAPPVPVTPQPGGCTSNAAFAGDVSVPAGTVMNAGQAFDKVWRVTNSGTCAWDASYQLVFSGGESMSAPAASAVPYSAPGSAVDLHVAMVAPAAAGAHAGQWRLRDGSGALFGPVLSASIIIGGGSPAPSAAAPTAGPSLTVSAATAGANPGNYTGTCPGVFNLFGTITTNGAGTVTYRWQASNQAPSGMLTYNAPAAGTFNLPNHQFTASIKGTLAGQLIVMTPNQIASNQAQVTNNCTDPRPAPPQAAILQPAGSYSGLVNQSIHFVFQGTSTGEVSSVSLYANNGLLSKQTTRSPLHQLQATYDWTPSIAATYDVWVVAADIFGQQTNSSHISVIIRQPAPTAAPTSTRVPPTAVPPTPVPQKPNVNGDWSGGKYLLELSEAIGCMGSSCPITGRWIEQTSGAPEITDINGSLNGSTLSFNIPGTMPGAPSKSFSGTVNSAGTSISGRLSTGESITFVR